MRPILGLRINGGVPVGVVEDDGVGAGEVDTDAAGTRGQNHTKNLTVPVELLHNLDSSLRFRTTVQTTLSRFSPKVCVGIAQVAQEPPARIKSNKYIEAMIEHLLVKISKIFGNFLVFSNILWTK